MRTYHHFLARSPDSGEELDSCPAEERAVAANARPPAIGQIVEIEAEFWGKVRGRVYRVSEPRKTHTESGEECWLVEVMIDPDARHAGERWAQPHVQ